MTYSDNLKAVPDWYWLDTADHEEDTLDDWVGATVSTWTHAQLKTAQTTAESRDCAGSTTSRNAAESKADAP